MTLGISLVLLAFSPAVQAEDAGLMLAVEEWIYVQAGRPEMPARYADTMAYMGSPCWKCRQAAMRRLERQTFKSGEWRFLVWGSHSRDRDISMRCRFLLARRHTCMACFGAGCCREYKAHPGEQYRWFCIRCDSWEAWHSKGYRLECRHCDGNGTLWGLPDMTTRQKRRFEAW
jgi:hypothetical protein